MLRGSVTSKCNWSRLALIAVVGIAAAVLTVTPALADVSVQLGDFFYPDGTQVTSMDGMPFAHGALLRFYDRQQANGIEWQLMTVTLIPGETYDVWLISVDGSITSSVGSGKANAVGDLNIMGHLFTDSPDAQAPFYMVITTEEGVPVQIALFPGV